MKYKEVENCFSISVHSSDIIFWLDWYDGFVSLNLFVPTEDKTGIWFNTLTYCTEHML